MEKDDILVCVVKHKNTGESIPFTLGKWGDVIITSTREYNLDDLIVSVERLKNLGSEPDERYFTVLK